MHAVNGNCARIIGCFNKIVKCAENVNKDEKEERKKITTSDTQNDYKII